MTILIGLIDKIVREKPARNILFLFQAAEEIISGARRILETKILDKFQIKSTYALHVTGSLPLGTVSTKPDAFFANTLEIDVTFTGKSSHVAFPEKGRNALKAGVTFYQIVKTMIDKEFGQEPNIVCEFGKMTAGNVRNSIPDICKLEGTLRSFQTNQIETMKRIIQKTGKALSIRRRVKFQREFLSNCKAVVNDPELYTKFKALVEKSEYSFKEAKTVMTGEDFGFFTDKYQGLLFWLGCDTGENQDLHSSFFLPNADCIEIGINIFYALIQ